MTTLAGIDLNDNLLLKGRENAPDVAYSVRDLLGGPVVTQIDQRDNAAAMALEAIGGGPTRMGHFCKHQIDALKIVAAQGQPVALTHLAGTFSVYILEFNVLETDEREPPNDPNKKYYGQILIQEV